MKLTFKKNGPGGADAVFVLALEREGIAVPHIVSGPGGGGDWGQQQDDGSWSKPTVFESDDPRVIDLAKQHGAAV